ncbi:glycine-rich domain-containing protein [Janthinobacterium sp. GB4P2]|uniref:glycine-rich domain-containing protein n=1 Tax=Janthinobacterium sp. GB4P2 TaxID=3424189 RepID=UPI003F1FE4E2
MDQAFLDYLPGVHTHHSPLLHCISHNALYQRTFMDTNDSFKAIADLNLDAIKVKLMHRESGEGWSLEKANAVEFEYRRFLILMKQFPEEETAPLMDVDTFWHYHILDTLKYAADCEQVFGYFLHHFPYIGLRGEDDEAAHQRVGERMKQLYEQTFGEDYIRAETAYSGRAVQAAYSGRAVQTAFSSAAVQATAYSGRAVQTAFSSAAVQATAYSGRAVQTAFSSAAVQATAYSGRATGAANTAFSSAPATLAAAVVKSSTTGLEMGRFYVDRPVLNRDPQ